MNNYSIIIITLIIEDWDVHIRILFYKFKITTVLNLIETKSYYIVGSKFFIECDLLYNNRKQYEV